MFEKLPFNRTGIAIMVFGGSFAGVYLIWSACKFQNKKCRFLSPASPSTESPCLHRGPSRNVASGKKSISVAP